MHKPITSDVLYSQIHWTFISLGFITNQLPTNYFLYVRVHFGRLNDPYVLLEHGMLRLTIALFDLPTFSNTLRKFLLQGKFEIRL